MAQNKKAEFSEADQKIADLARVLGHPARIAILRILAEKNTCICGEIVEVLPLAQSTVSQHLKELLQAKLIQGTVDGLKSCYCINHETVTEFSKELDFLFKDLLTQPNCCN
ncbi:winged helix-turn-helix transcriptional regulator [Flavihumibacter sp. R14]|nr:winged helix-turn-helix transcriptional regulator [Flavihumibacter soli]